MSALNAFLKNAEFTEIHISHKIWINAKFLQDRSGLVLRGLQNMLTSSCSIRLLMGAMTSSVIIQKIQDRSGHVLRQKYGDVIAKSSYHTKI